MILHNNVKFFEILIKTCPSVTIAAKEKTSTPKTESYIEAEMVLTILEICTPPNASIETI